MSFADAAFARPDGAPRRSRRDRRNRGQPAPPAPVKAEQEDPVPSLPAEEPSNSAPEQDPAVLAELIAEQVRQQIDAEAAAAGLDAAGTERYRQAVEAFESEFPTLGGGPALRPSPTPPADVPVMSPLVESMRRDALAARFPWVDAAAVAHALSAARGSLVCAEAVLASYPKPAGWDAAEAARREAEAAAAAKAARAAGARGGRLGNTRDVGDWVDTGASVAAMYAGLRAEAAKQAGLRNAYFDRARAAMLRGDRAEAASLGAKGRAVNKKMFELHEQAADTTFNARNPPGREGYIDLHGLHVTEALDRLPDALAQAPGATVRVLTGAGHHSKGTGTARLRPKVEAFLKEEGYRFELVVDRNEHVGAFVVYLTDRRPF